MTSHTRRVLLGAAALAAGAALTADGASAETLRFMTGPQGGSWYPLGGAMKSLIEDEQPGTAVQILPGAGIANVKAIEAGKADIAFANSVSTVDAIKGRPPFEGEAQNICHLATLYPQYFQIVALADQGIESVADLKGKSFTTQPTGNTGEAITAHLLEAYDLSYDDLSRVSFVSYNDSVALMKDGNAAGFTLGTTIPASAVMDLASARDIKLLEVPDDRMARLQEMNPGYKARTVPAGTYPGQDADVQTIGYATHVIARCDLADETVQAVLNQIIEHQQDLASVAKAVGETPVEEMAADIGVPMHPAAEAFFQEKGAL